MKYHIVLDTNVIVSAMITKNTDAPTVVLFRKLIADDRIVLLVNDAILSEYREVLHRSKFGLDSYLVDTTVDMLESIATKVNGKPYRGRMPDPKDVMFVEVSLSVAGSKIITGNRRHFPEIDNVMSPSEFLSLMETYD